MAAPVLNATPGPTANTYALIAEADSYHNTVDPRVAQVWYQASTGDKTRALINATRLLDQHFVWIGDRADSVQSLAWPRCNVPLEGKFDPNRFNPTYWLDDATIPQWLVNATAEFARILLTKDVLSAEDGDDVKEVVMGDVSVKFDTNVAATGVIQASVFAWVRAFGDYKPNLNSKAGGLTTVRLVRA